MLQSIRKIGRRLLGHARGSGAKYGWVQELNHWPGEDESEYNYAGAEILEKVSQATQRVIQGNALFERDSVLFYEPSYNWQFLTHLLWVQKRLGRPLQILDFGGSLGSLYWQHRPYLSEVASSWNVVEQESFVEEGRRIVPSDQIQFWSTIEDCASEGPIDLLICSTVLQYLPDPFLPIKQAIDVSIPFALIDRTPFAADGRQRIMLQKVDPSIYEASYPCHFFNENDFLNELEQSTRVLFRFGAQDGYLGGANYRGMLLDLAAR